jgi:hypothetical protein
MKRWITLWTQQILRHTARAAGVRQQILAWLKPLFST